MSNRLLSLSLAFLLVLSPTRSNGEFILDEFDVQQAVDSSGVNLLRSYDVSTTPSFRTLGAVAIGANATGEWRADTSVTYQSVLNMSASDLVLENGGYGLLGVSYSFIFDDVLIPVDFTEGGNNNAMKLDFSYSRGPTPVRNIRILVGGDRVIAFTLLEPLPQTESSFSVYVPFDSFTDRGGQPIDFPVEVSSAEFQFQSAGNGFFPFHNDRGWEVGVDRISVVSLPETTQCDFDSDGFCGIGDLDMMHSNGILAQGYASSGSEMFDLNGDGQVDLADRQVWLNEAAYVNGLSSSYLVGDANLDGNVDVSDFNAWNMNRFTSSLLWSAGNSNGDAVVDVSDFNAWNMNKFQLSSSNAAIVPEPASVCSLLIALLLIAFFSERRTRNSINEVTH